MTRSEALPAEDAGPPTGRPLRALVACNAIGFGGAHLRFERTAAVLRAWGHEVAWLCQTRPEGPKPFRTALDVYDLETALGGRWDAVMIPGGGFSEATLAWFEALRDPRFGVRVQHVLSGPVRRESFEAVHRHFAPDVVVFNNVAWPAADRAALPAPVQRVLVGAVDLVAFRPRPYRAHPLLAGRWVVGGQSRKNPEPLIAALRTLPEGVQARLYGPDDHGLAARHADLVATGRLQLVGPLEAEAMARFYQDVDCYVATETVAGWANAVAEAMASGVPVLCTEHGTWDLAHDGETALVVPTPSCEALAAGIGRLMGDPALCERLAVAGRATAERFGWEAYARDLLAIVQHAAAAGAGRLQPEPMSEAELGRVRAEQRLRRAEADLEAARAHLAAMRTSASWRLTAPVRQLSRLARRLLASGRREPGA